MNYDVAVVGGGLVGSTFALAAAQAGLRVALLEARPAPEIAEIPEIPRTPETGPVSGPHDPSSDRPYDPRVSTVIPAVRDFLTSLGVWARLEHRRVTEFGEMVVWDGAGHGRVRFQAAEAGMCDLGSVLENQNLLLALESSLADTQGLEVFRPAQISQLRAEEDGVVLTVPQGKLHARLVVGADGSNSAVREWAGLDARFGDYGQKAAVAIVQSELGHQYTAWQRFLADGPLALLPLPGGRACVVWSTSPEHAEALVSQAPREFESEVERGCDRVLGGMQLVSRRAAFPLRYVHARRYIGHRIALIGDAAHTVHPLAGQGVNLGLMDAAALARACGATVERGRDLGLEANLRPFERERRSQSVIMGQALNGFHRIFTASDPVVRMARNLGLSAAGAVAPARRFFIRYASGLGGFDARPQ